MINRIFSDKYVNHGAVVGNILLLLMYRFAYPFAYILNKLGLSPNQITTQSLVFSIFAFLALILDDGWVLFSVFWGLAVLFDFCDGTVARMTDRVSKTAFRYDHISDLFKISLVILGAGIRYQESLIWVLSFIACFSFMYLVVLSHDLGGYMKELNRSAAGSKNTKILFSDAHRRDRSPVVAWLFRRVGTVDFLKKIYIPLATINGHTLLIFFLLPLGANFSAGIFLYLILISIINIKICIKGLLSIKR